ncbi:MAG: tripartite tricarboxylate transporter permease [Methanomassiliicoccales archaeon]|nr:tripartite tricarboxylate transporter permease [Methanomassiliicoccales archaeon]
MDLQVPLLVAYFSLAGASLGIVTGLAPGIHANTLALLLVTLYGPIQGSLSWLCGTFDVDVALVPLLVSTIIVSAAVVHSFVDFIPSVFLGAPDESQVLSVLPGHRLLLAGKGLEAVRCAAVGSFVGALIAMMLVVPMKFLMGPPVDLYETIGPLIPYILVIVLVMLILSERRDPNVKASIDVRSGSIERSGSVVSIVPPIPVDGESIRISGVVSLRSPRRWQLSSSFGTWDLITGGDCSPGFATVSGTWRIAQRRWRKTSLAASIALISGILGFVVLNARLPGYQLCSGLGETLLFPLLTGLFGLPTLLFSLNSGRIPAQASDPTADADVLPALKGAAIGGFVGWFPGVTSTAGGVIGSLVSRRERTDPFASARGFVTMVSAIGTSATVFSLAALAIIGRGRSGTMLAVKDIVGREGIEALSAPISSELSLLLLSVLISSGVGYIVTLWLGRSFGGRLAGANLKRLTIAIVIVLLSLVSIFNGIPGLIVLGVATMLGAIPPLVGVSRVHLTGCLLIPIIIFFAGLEPTLLIFLGG